MDRYVPAPQLPSPASLAGVDVGGMSFRSNLAACGSARAALFADRQSRLAAERSKNVSIILSTYNGSAFLCEQLASIRQQSHRDWCLLWRDDGSSDSTRSILEEFALQSRDGQVVGVDNSGDRLGVGRSFFTLLRYAPAGDVVAFCDQDDVWLEDKLVRGVNALAKIDPAQPALYCARQTLVDESLRRLGESSATPPSGFPMSIAQNIATGCTTMLNASAVSLIKSLPSPQTEYHDWWCYVVVTAANGVVIVDPKPALLYRQHSANTIGVRRPFWRRAAAALRRGPRAYMSTLRAFVTALDERRDLLSPSAQNTLAAIAPALRKGWPSRLAILRRCGIRRQAFFENQVFRVWFLLG